MHEEHINFSWFLYTSIAFTLAIFCCTGIYIVRVVVYELSLCAIPDCTRSSLWAIHLYNFSERPPEIEANRSWFEIQVFNRWMSKRVIEKPECSIFNIFTEAKWASWYSICSCEFKLTLVDFRGGINSNDLVSDDLNIMKTDRKSHVGV